METQDGFTFKRVKTGQTKRKPIPAVENEADSFIFHKVAQKEQEIRNTEFYAINNKNTIGIDNATSKKVGRRKKTGNKLKAPKKKAETKKSLNIQDTIIDLPSDSTVREALDNGDMLSCSYEDTLKLELPVEKEKLKSDELYKISNGEINKLLLECFKFLKIDGMNYTKEVTKSLLSRKYKQPNFDAEIKRTKELIKTVENEEQKWREILASEIEKNNIREEPSNLTGNSPIETKNKIEVNEHNEKIKSEMTERAKEVNLAEEKFSFKVDQLKARVEVLVRNIFEAEEKPEVDPVFLLRAMTKL
ncbi:hypothetical protein NUSPORA_01243 [Nucleospora cyclopteri]